MNEQLTVSEDDELYTLIAHYSLEAVLAAIAGICYTIADDAHEEGKLALAHDWQSAGTYLGRVSSAKKIQALS